MLSAVAKKISIEQRCETLQYLSNTIVTDEFCTWDDMSEIEILVSLISPAVATMAEWNRSGRVAKIFIIVTTDYRGWTCSYRFDNVLKDWPIY